ncbi:Uncharacterised protein [Yersinia intermedia]|nr:Uncharacterised protein [Yersinia intermedia]CNG78662.1 Uncharacterised protein [Yersinia intermedia]
MSTDTYERGADINRIDQSVQKPQNHKNSRNKKSHFYFEKIRIYFYGFEKTLLQ